MRTMRIDFVVHTQNSNDQSKEAIYTILQNALEQFRTQPELILVSGNPARLNYETVFGEHVTLKVAR